MKHSYIIFLLYICFINCKNVTTEFLYPLESIVYQGEEKLLVLYQNNDHLEIFFWDPHTKIITKALLSSFIPAGARVLPHKQAFSFIDHDRVRIKNVSRKSPKTIDLPYGPYDINLILWENNSRFYFSAYEHHHKTIFFAGINGELTRLFPPFYGKNIGYPQKINDVLFFVGKEDDGVGTIERTIVTDAMIEEAFSKNNDSKNNHKIFTIKTSYDPTTVDVIFSLDTKEEEIIFLSMQNIYKGYFLTHNSYIEKDDTHLTFKVYSLEQRNKDSSWEATFLFSYVVPLDLFIPYYSYHTRLYESILPLIPYYSDTDIIYTHDTGEGLSLYKYVIATGENLLLVSHNKYKDYIQHAFKLTYYNNTYYYGGTVCHRHDSCTESSHVHLELTSDGVLKCHLPQLYND